MGFMTVGYVFQKFICIKYNWKYKYFKSFSKIQIEFTKCPQ